MIKMFQIFFNPTHHETILLDPFWNGYQRILDLTRSFWWYGYRDIRDHYEAETGDVPEREWYRVRKKQGKRILQSFHSLISRKARYSYPQRSEKELFSSSSWSSPASIGEVFGTGTWTLHERIIHPENWDGYPDDIRIENVGIEGLRNRPEDPTHPWGMVKTDARWWFLCYPDRRH